MIGAHIQEIPKAQLAAKLQTPANPYAVLHPVASAPDKTWPAEHFLRVAERLDTVFNIEPIFIGAGDEEMSPFLGYPNRLGEPLREVMSLIASATLFIGNDSGPAHMAAAFGVPMAVVFGNSDRLIWGPWKANAEVLMSPDGISAIPPEEMIEAIEKLGVKA